MRFEARELKPYAEPVPPAELKEGSVYFAVNYVDEELKIPIMETLVLERKDLDENGLATLHWQDVESYRAGIHYGAVPEEYPGWPKFFQCAEDQAKNIFEYEQALDVLLRCSLRRKGIEGTG